MGVTPSKCFSKSPRPLKLGFLFGVMRAELIKKRDDGSSIQIVASLNTDGFRNEFTWSISVYTKPKGAKNWLSVYSSDDYEFRKLNQKERESFISSKQGQHCTKDEILEAKMLVWESIKPTI
jgi:hypothetical protein